MDDGGLGERLMNAPPYRLQELCDAANEHDLYPAADMLDALITRATRASVYAEMRAQGSGHAAAMKASNVAVRRVRKALGYNVTHDLNF